MPKKEIDLLNKQIEKLKIKDFDLEAWKKYTIIILARIFGDNSQKIRQIESIEYDYSSWSLRDTSGSSSYLETCKKLGREILEASIEELKTFGLPDRSEEGTDMYFEAITNALKDELKGSQFRELRDILVDLDDPEEIREKVIERLKLYGSEVSTEVLASILADHNIIKKFKQ
jgi:hypothetical protein